MNFLPESEVINLKYQLAQQIKASINRAASGRSTNTPFLDSCVDTLIDEMAELKIEISKLSLTLSSLKNAEPRVATQVAQTLDGDVEPQPEAVDEFWQFPIVLNPEYLQHLDNFHYPEESPNGRYFIWMGSGNKASVELPIEVLSPIKLILKNVRFISEATRSTFKLYINGEQLEYESVKQEEGDGYCISASWMPLHNSIKDKCVLDMFVEQSVDVREIYPETNDTRRLCLALNEIEVQNNVQEYVNT